MNWKSPHNRTLPTPQNTPLVMGILNVGAESFSDGGKYSSETSALKHAEQMISDGADIIDIGAESTRPQASFLPLNQEIEILMPKLKAVRKHFPDIPISVDTYKPEVAKIAISEGADIINDVYAFMENGKYQMAQTAALLGAPLILTHCCRGEVFDGEFFDFFMQGMQERIACALNSCIERDMLVIDVGIGFGKTREQNFELVKRLEEVRSFGLPILLGVSRKSMFADIAGNSIPMRDVATLAVSVFASRSCDILRVHDVKSNVLALKTISNLI